MKRLLPLLLLMPLALALGACGSDDADDLRLPDSPDPAAPSTTVVVTATVAGTSTSRTLECEPTGGDHPDAAAACTALLAAAREGLLAPPPADRVCTEIYGGPEVARIVGTVQGQPVDRALNRRDGCGVADWEAMGAVLPALA